MITRIQSRHISITTFLAAIIAALMLIAANMAFSEQAYAAESDSGTSLMATTAVQAGSEEQAVPYTGKGTFFISSPYNSKRVIGMKKDDRTNAANVVVCKKRYSNLFRFMLVPAGGGFYYIKNVGTNRQLGAVWQKNGKATGKANAAMFSAKRMRYQQWKVMKYPDGTVSFINRSNGLTLQMAGTGAVGYNVNLRTAWNNRNQRFKLVKTKKNVRETVKLNVPCYSQFPQLPTGCESVALTNDLRYWGFKLGKTTIANKWLPYGGNGVYNFIGNPHNGSGWIICAPGIAKTAKRYLKSKNSKLHVKVYHGKNLKYFKKFLAKGYPVIVWATDRMRSPGPVRAYRSGYMLRGNTHTMVLAGYNPKTKKYYLSDSISGRVWRDEKRFDYLYRKMGRQAVVIYD